MRRQDAPTSAERNSPADAQSAGDDRVDADRGAVYAAEVAAFDGTDLEVVVDFDVLRTRVTEVTAGEWWPGPPVDVRPARVGAHSSSARCSESATEHDTVVIRLAARQMTLATAAHELAHALAGPARGHGAEFRRAYLDVIAVITNTDPSDRRRTLHVDQLAAAFDAFGLAIGERRWRPPPETASGAIVL
jgi:hypothetical protein